MNCTEYLENLKSIYANVLEYIDDDSEDKFKNIKDIITNNKITDNQYELKMLLYLLSKIVDNHHRTSNFFTKIERILEYLKEDLRKNFSNSKLFDIFSSNKRILLFLIESKIIIIDELIVKQIIQGRYLSFKYPQYFQPEIQPFINEKWFPKYKEDDDKDEEEDYDIFSNNNKWVLEIEKEIPTDFYERRRIGENDHYICELIRKDSIDDFIICMNQNNYEFNSRIKPSIYETNNFILERGNRHKNPKLIEYAVFYGSIQIFNYLKSKKVELKPSLWYYAIHSRNAEIIQLLEENQIKPKFESYEQIFIESIKCHHNDTADYIRDNYLENEQKKLMNQVFVNGLEYRNFYFLDKEQINEAAFHYLCKYDYYTLVSILLNTKDIDINCKTAKGIYIIQSMKQHCI